MMKFPTLVLGCPYCDWSTRMELEADSDVLQLGEQMVRVQRLHMLRVHGTTIDPEMIAQLRADVLAGNATHECHEWVDDSGLCALCGTRFS